MEDPDIQNVRNLPSAESDTKFWPEAPLPAPESSRSTGHETEPLPALADLVRQIVREEMQAAQRPLTVKLAATTSMVEAWLVDLRERAETFGPTIRELLDNLAELTTWMDGRTAQIQQETSRKLDEVVKRIAAQAGEAMSRSKDTEKRTTAALEELERARRNLGWRPWLVAASCAAGTILLLTLLRPGWTMSREQRTALRVGEAVIYTYGTATEPERTEMRRAMRWRAPQQPDSPEVPIVEKPRR